MGNDSNNAPALLLLLVGLGLCSKSGRADGSSNQTTSGSAQRVAAARSLTNLRPAQEKHDSNCKNNIPTAAAAANEQQGNEQSSKAK
jgi:hypothetical protein